ncbi:hypothetical protein DBR43_14025 [Pedobacter sp. KBW06]|uniref:DUF6266 family protein n=1 Tax=Pedobacter sp. KBW06 TaxID=2153359 RepID=UPI000F5A9026|nr:DUF6266 family protein [Pedobacter sp. KBW06]RQO72319.1 hypothetical protein DBR43_14025 [Pedobacter sp. KBW06]
MAKAPSGPLGALNGKLRNLVFYMLNGQPVVRTIGDPGKPSRGQLANRQAMSVTMEMVSRISEFTNVSFELEARGTVRNAHNLATSYIKKHALKGEYPNISVDYSKVILSNGNLPGANDLKIEKKEKGVLVSWDPSGKQDDTVMILLYHPLEKAAMSVINACRRDAGSYFIDLYEKRLDEPIEAYICFKSANGKAISDSAYIGNLNGAVESAEELSQKQTYALVKQRFDVVEADYLQQIAANYGNPVNTKAFRNLKKEYKVLKDKLEHLPGKPG